MLDQDEKLRSFETSLLNDLHSNAAVRFINPAVERLHSRYNKRFIYSDIDLQQEAFEKFIVTNEQVSTKGGTIKMPFIEGEILGEAQEFIFNALSSYTRKYSDYPQDVLDEGHLYSLWRLGPGASNGVFGTHFCDKIQKRFTCTTKAIPFLRKLIATTHRLKTHYEFREISIRMKQNLRRLSGAKVLSDRKIEDLVRPYVEVKGSRLSSVRKNQETNRTIAIEPSGNMALQLAAGMYVEGALRGIGLDISKQQLINKDLARQGSITGDLCTIDLKSASDLISLDLIRALWPPEWFNFLSAIRSEYVKVDSTWVKLNMLSTMGNGFTFPVMTLTLLALVYSVMRVRAIKAPRRNFVDWKVVGVYGDDIICPSVYFPDVVNVLSCAGLIINVDKSFSEGPFRESCGGDYYCGGNITPFYVSSLANDAEVNVALNKVLKWSSYHRVFLFSTIRYLLSILEKRYLIPEWHDPSSGILSLYPEYRYKYLRVTTVYKTREIRTDLDLLCVLGGYCSPHFEDYFQGDRGGFKYSPRVEENTYTVKKARIPEGYSDGHDPYYSDREESKLRWSFITIAAV